MPVARFQMPDGRIARFEVPEGTTPEQAHSMMAQHFAAPKADPAEKPGGVMQTLGNLAAGAVRGAGSIGATLLTPYDLIAGNTKSIGNPERRQAMDAGLQEMGAQPDSLAYGGGKLIGEIAGTAGVGGTLARGLGAVIPKSAPILEAIGSAGFKAGGMTGPGGLAARSIGGGVTGTASAGLVNPDEALMGGAAGAVAPGLLQGMGKIGGGVGRLLRGPEQSAELAAGVKAAQDAGYVIPPTQARASLGNRLLEGLAGKITTAQNASAANQGTTNRMAARALGLADDTQLTPDVLQGLRKSAGAAYDAIGSTGTVTAGKPYEQALDAIAAPYLKAAQGFPGAKPSPVVGLVDSLRTDSFDAASAVAKIKELRSAADDAFRTGNTDIGRASKSAATALEDALDSHLQDIGSPDMLDAFRGARKLIAKTYTVEKALNPVSGSVDARRLAAQLKAGKPLSGELRDAASFAAQFPKAAQTVEQMGSLPQLSPLDWAAGGSIAAGLSNPIGLAGILARPAARKAALSPMVQRGLLQQPAASGLLDPEAIAGLHRFGLLSAPILAADR